MLTAENKNELNVLLASHKMTSHLAPPAIADAAMLATVAKMAREGKDEMALYVLHNVEPYALTEKPEEEPSLDINDLLCFLRS